MWIISILLTEENVSVLFVLLFREHGVEQIQTTVDNDVRDSGDGAPILRFSSAPFFFEHLVILLLSVTRQNQVQNL